jgi:hypothetical protein
MYARHDKLYFFTIKTHQMKNTVYKLEQKNPQTLGFNDELLIVSSKDHTSFDKLQDAVVKSGLLETVKTYELKSITKISCVEGEDDITIYYTDNGKEKEMTYTFDNINAVRWVADGIAEHQQLKKEDTYESPTGPLMWNAAKAIPAAVVAYMAIVGAAEQVDGVEREFSGRRSGMMRLAYSALGYMGPYITSAIAAVIVGYFVYAAYARYKNPALVTVYTR